MITLEKLTIYREFNGDIDGWARVANGKAKSHMTDADWYLIDELLMGLTIVGTGLASPSFMHEVESKMLSSTIDEATRAALRALAVQQRRDNAA